MSLFRLSVQYVHTSCVQWADLREPTLSPKPGQPTRKTKKNFSLITGQILPLTVTSSLFQTPVSDSCFLLSVKKWILCRGPVFMGGQRIWKRSDFAAVLMEIPQCGGGPVSSNFKADPPLHSTEQNVHPERFHVEH